MIRRDLSDVGLFALAASHARRVPTRDEHWERRRREDRDRTLDELRARARRKIVRLLPNPTGTCSAGRRVVLDTKGAYSSGYWLHVDGTNRDETGRIEPGFCDHRGIETDPPTPETKRLLALLRELRDEDVSTRRKGTRR